MKAKYEKIAQNIKKKELENYNRKRKIYNIKKPFYNII